MNARELLNILSVAERLKDTTRHCYTTKGRRESVAEHCWMLSLMAYFLKDEFPELNMDKVIQMSLIHDLGECFTGDIPVFLKDAKAEDTEKALLMQWVDGLPQEVSEEMNTLYEEMETMESAEAKTYKALDCIEALIQHNFSDLSTWEPHEYELSMTYGDDKVPFSEYLCKLREEIRQDTIEKIKAKKD